MIHVSRRCAQLNFVSQLRAIREQNKLYLEKKFKKYGDMLSNMENRPACVSCAPLLDSDAVWRAGLKELHDIDLDKGKAGHPIALLMASLREHNLKKLPEFDLKKRVSWTQSKLKDFLLEKWFPGLEEDVEDGKKSAKLISYITSARVGNGGASGKTAAGSRAERRKK